MLKMEDDGASCSLATSRTDEPASPLAHPHVAPVFTGLHCAAVAAGDRVACLHSRQTQRRGGFLLLSLLCFSVICDNYYSFTARAGQDDVFQPLKMFPSIRAHWCTKAELRPARSASGREALLVLRLRRVLLGSHACEAARGCRLVHLKGEGRRGESIVPHR